MQERRDRIPAFRYATVQSYFLGIRRGAERLSIPQDQSIDWIGLLVQSPADRGVVASSLGLYPSWGTNRVRALATYTCCFAGKMTSLEGRRGPDGEARLS